jgi:hypothetical protein
LSSKILTPHPPLSSARRECPPPTTKAGGTHSPGGEGDGGSIFWKMREIGLASCNDLSTFVSIWGFHFQKSLYLENASIKTGSTRISFSKLQTSSRKIFFCGILLTFLWTNFFYTQCILQTFFPTNELVKQLTSTHISKKELQFWLEKYRAWFLVQPDAITCASSHMNTLRRKK